MRNLPPVTTRLGKMVLARSILKRCHRMQEPFTVHLVVHHLMTKVQVMSAKTATTILLPVMMMICKWMIWGRNVVADKTRNVLMLGVLHLYQIQMQPVMTMICKWMLWGLTGMGDGTLNILVLVG